MAKRVLQGIEVDEERLAFECIKRVGPAGNYLSDELTIKLMNKEFYYPKLADRKPYMVWEQEGKKTTEERAREKVKVILAEHKPLPIPEEIDAQIRAEIPDILPETGKIYGE